jgi:hypothetical protein
VLQVARAAAALRAGAAVWALEEPMRLVLATRVLAIWAPPQAPAAERVNNRQSAPKSDWGFSWSQTFRKPQSFFALPLAGAARYTHALRSRKQSRALPEARE